MSDIDYQLKNLKANLAQEFEILSVISDSHNHVEIKEHIKYLQAAIKKLEDWKEKQTPIRAGMDVQQQSERGSITTGGLS